jgi:probable rRNA maturation factor
MSDDPDTADSPHLTVTLVDEQDVALDPARLVAVARSAAVAEGAVGEISLLLVATDRMAELHEEHMGEPGPTDVLSFPVDGLVTEPPPPGAPPVLVGEVVVCPAVALAQADRAPFRGRDRALGVGVVGGDPPDLAGELDLLVVHGVLHLLGHDHDTLDAAARMREREQQHAGRAGAQAG